MKKPVLTIITLFIIAAQALAQTITAPYVEQKDDNSTFIKKIETSNLFTIITFETIASQGNTWVQLNKEMFIQTDLSNAHYEYVKSENITMVPGKYFFKSADDKLEFKVYFKKIPATAKSIDIIEHAGLNKPGVSYFNFYNVSLTEQAGTRTQVTKVVLIPPPPIQVDTAISMGSTYSGGNNEMQNAMNSMAPMYASMAKSMLDAQLAYFKQPGKIAEMAKLQKAYYNALMKEGIAHDDALKIVIADSIIPKSSINGQ